MVVDAMSPIKIFRAPEAASYTGLSESTLAKRRLRGDPPVFVRLGAKAIGYRHGGSGKLADGLPPHVHVGSGCSVK